MRQTPPKDFIYPDEGLKVESRVKTLWLLNKGRTIVTVKLPSDNIIGDKDLEMLVDMDNTSCNKGLKDIRIMLFRRLTVRNKEQPP
jgi:hypothetical protein